jgi:apolipoprotein D and lipocalin family protein
MKHLHAAMAVTLSLLAPLTARAAAPEPAKPVSAAFYSGKWYEIARLPTKTQKDCVAGQSQFTAKGDGGFSVVQTCRVGSLSGPLKTYDTTGKILPSTNNAKFQLAFFGGVVKQEYWVIDRDDGLSWAVMGTPGGNFAWLMSRRPTLSAAVRDAIVARLKAAGYKTDRLIFPLQPAG